MRRVAVPVVCVLVVAFALPAPAQAPADVNVGAIYLCNELTLRIRFPAGGQSIEQRREAVRLRIVRAYATEQVTAANIVARPVGADWAIYVGRQLIITVDQNHARANNTTTAALAQLWLARLRDLMPRCRPDPNPPGSRP
ncbi:MAG: hypothetical protein QN163_00925 [Armatimonadota bacterium]|nr:hypothetical protein [Armatimonadota bacterium]MDR5697365.1 hypothetical protein [Armatimonadota bacterium]